MRRYRVTVRKLGAAAAIGSLLLLGACGDDDDNDDVATPPAGDFATVDANGDSYLDADEIAEWVDDSGTFATWDADSDSELDRDEISGNAFKLWDADDDGTISKREWKDGTDLWYPDTVQRVTFGDWDGDGDPELDADEFSERFDVSTLGESWRVEAFNDETFRKAYFELYDTDDDGRVSKSEWTSGSSAFGIAK